MSSPEAIRATRSSMILSSELGLFCCCCCWTGLLVLVFLPVLPPVLPHVLLMLALLALLVLLPLGAASVLPLTLAVEATCDVSSSSSSCFSRGQACKTARRGLCRFKASMTVCKEWS